MRTLPEDTMPAIEAELVDGGTWRLAEEHPSKLALLVFYCGVDCPICRKWITALERLLPRFVEHGVSVIALSCDRREGAERAKRAWKLAGLRVGFGIASDDARKAGLYLSEKDGVFHTEPGILAVKPGDGTLYAAWVQSGPHGRPRFADVLSAVESMLAHGLPRPPGGA
jgi:peroxiredoxin